MPTLERPPLQFAAVREDPRTEERILREHSAHRVLVVASGGCTALHLRARFPDLEIDLVDPNPAQHAHVSHKIEALAALEPRRFDVGPTTGPGLQECGNFERLFGVFRAVLDSFVVTVNERRRLCADLDADWSDVVSHPYWPVAFSLAFDDAMLLAMFGPNAIQHAERGSYPAYFRQRIEAGLSAPDRAANPWLHHVLLGHYLDDPRAWPPFLRDPPRDLRPFPRIVGELAAVPSFAPYDLVQLSNVLDWTDDAGCRALALRLAAELRPGARILWRQLNDPRDLVGHFAAAFDFDPRLDAELTAKERSLFYDRVHSGARR